MRPPRGGRISPRSITQGNTKMDKNQKWILASVALFLAVLVGLTVYFTTMRTPDDTGFTAPPFAQNAVNGTPEGIDETLGYHELSYGENFKVSLCTMPVVDRDGVATVYFTSPASNDFYARLIIYNESGREIGSTDLLLPGQYVTSVQLTSLPKDGAELTFKIVSYAPETYYSKGFLNAKVSIHLIK